MPDVSILILIRADLSVCPGPSHNFDCVTCLEDSRIAPGMERRSGARRLASAVRFQRSKDTSPLRLLAVLARRAIEVALRSPPNQPRRNGYSTQRDARVDRGGDYAAEVESIYDDIVKEKIT